jgi:hypothetical protein
MKIARVAPANTERPFPIHLRWMEKARCLRKGTHNFWLPSKRPTPKQYEAVKREWCYPCPVRAECLLNVLRKETADRHTSRGVEGGATPRERMVLRRRIRDAQICMIEGVWRFLNKKPISRTLPTPSQRNFVVTITNKDAELIYEHKASAPKGAHMIAMRELRRLGGDLVASVRNPNGSVIEVMRTQDLPKQRVRSRRNPYLSES